MGRIRPTAPGGELGPAPALPCQAAGRPHWTAWRSPPLPPQHSPWPKNQASGQGQTAPLPGLPGGLWPAAARRKRTGGGWPTRRPPGLSARARPLLLLRSPGWPGRPEGRNAEAKKTSRSQVPSSGGQGQAASRRELPQGRSSLHGSPAAALGNRLPGRHLCPAARPGSAVNSRPGLEFWGLSRSQSPGKRLPSPRPLAVGTWLSFRNDSRAAWKGRGRRSFSERVCHRSWQGLCACKSAGTGFSGQQDLLGNPGHSPRSLETCLEIKDRPRKNESIHDWRAMHGVCSALAEPHTAWGRRIPARSPDRGGGACAPGSRAMGGEWQHDSRRRRKSPGPRGAGPVGTEALGLAAPSSRTAEKGRPGV